MLPNPQSNERPRDDYRVKLESLFRIIRQDDFRLVVEIIEKKRDKLEKEVKELADNPDLNNSIKTIAKQQSANSLTDLLKKFNNIITERNRIRESEISPKG